jgi:hypothetical protein
MLGQLQLRQATLSFHQSGRVDANRPGPRPKAPTTLTAKAAALIPSRQQRRKVGGANEANLIEAFARSRKHAAARE